MVISAFQFFAYEQLEDLDLCFSDYTLYPQEYAAVLITCCQLLYCRYPCLRNFSSAIKSYVDSLFNPRAYGCTSVSHDQYT